MRVKLELIRRGLTVTGLAKKLRVSRVAASRAINQPELLPSVRRRIEKELALS